jgi:RimJ/RimL family protein N-acetyltransferase
VPHEALTSAGTRFFPRDAASAVVVLQLGGSCVVVGPGSATDVLDGLDQRMLLDADGVAERLGGFAPRPIGTASLWFRDRRPVEHPSVGTRRASPSTVEELRASIQADEWDESGLSTMPQRWGSFTPEGRPAAVAGYERWGADVAQIGVAASSSERGRGYAAAAAAMAMTMALGEDLVLQWRGRIGNVGSERLAVRLGYTRLGLQSAVALG